MPSPGTRIQGQLLGASLENSASDLTPTSTGLVYFNTSITTPKWYTGSAWIIAADTSTAQVFTNKDIDGGTASNTSRITLPKASTATISGLTRKQATLLYDTTLGSVVFDTGATVTALSTSAPATPTTSGTVTSFVPAVASAINTVSAANYTILTTDGYGTIAVSLLSGADRTITLPATASNVGRRIRIVRTATDGEGSARVLVVCAGADVVYGGSSTTQTTVYLDRRFQNLELECVASGVWSQVEATGTALIGTVTLDGGFTGGSIHIIRQGNLVCIQMESPTWSSGSTSRSSTTAFIPSGMRPGARTVFSAACRNGSHGYDVTFVAETNGTVTVQTSDGAATSMDDYANASGCYLLRN